ncbi:MAG TPA: sugar ABC transporter permease [Treponema sp.]|nr:sugar ABC transporter permease [Treponema sp.]
MSGKYTRLEKKKFKWIYFFLLPSLLIFVVFYLYAIANVFITSFTKWDGFNEPHFIFVKNYLHLFTDSTFLISLRNLLVWSLLAGTVHVGFGVLVAFILYRRPFGWKFTRAVFMIPNVISAAAWSLIYKFIFNNDMGILNHLIRRIIPGFSVQWYYQSPYAFWAITLTWLFYAVIVTLLVLNDLFAVPNELLEAAGLDGASGWQIVTKIQLPLCRYSIGTGVICSVTARIAMYEQIIFTTAGGPGDDTMNLPLILVQAINNMKYGYANAVSVVMVALGLLVLMLINKLFRMNERVY